MGTFIGETEQPVAPTERDQRGRKTSTLQWLPGDNRLAETGAGWTVNSGPPAGLAGPWPCGFAQTWLQRALHPLQVPCWRPACLMKDHAPFKTHRHWRLPSEGTHSPASQNPSPRLPAPTTPGGGGVLPQGHGFARLMVCGSPSHPGQHSQKGGDCLSPARRTGRKARHLAGLCPKESVTLFN